MPRSYKTESRTPKDNKYPSSKLTIEESEYNTQYRVCLESPTWTLTGFPGWKAPGSFPSQLATGWDVPRSMGTTLDPQLEASYHWIVANDLCENEIPSRNAALKDEKHLIPEPQKHQAGHPGLKEQKTKPSQEKSYAKDMKQNAQDIQHIAAAEHRQININQNTEDDAETDEESSQNSNSNQPNGDN